MLLILQFKCLHMPAPLPFLSRLYSGIFLMIYHPIILGARHRPARDALGPCGGAFYHEPCSQQPIRYYQDPAPTCHVRRRGERRRRLPLLLLLLLLCHVSFVLRIIYLRNLSQLFSSLVCTCNVFVTLGQRSSSRPGRGRRRRGPMALFDWWSRVRHLYRGIGICAEDLHLAQLEQRRVWQWGGTADWRLQIGGFAQGA